jgi:small nuclear ribonucleoprotein (snRNP)-like protein
MLKKIFTAIISALLLQAAAAPAFAGTTVKKDAERAEKVRTQFAKLGTGKDARVKVELRDKTKLEGYLSAADAGAFAVTDNAGKTTTVPYQDVSKAKGNNLSTGAKIAIGIGIGVGVTILVLYLYVVTHED